MSAYSTCKELMLFEMEGVKYEPDLVLVLHTSAEERNVDDAALCVVGPDGSLTLQPATFSRCQEIVRGLRGYIRSHSHFLTFVLDRLTRIESNLPWNHGRASGQGPRNVALD
jgi:hypothetical protein